MMGKRSMSIVREVALLIIGCFATLGLSSYDQDTLNCMITIDEIEYEQEKTEIEPFDRRKEIEFICNPVQKDGSISALSYPLSDTFPDNLKEIYRSRFEWTDEIMIVSIPGGRLALDSVIIPDGNNIEIINEGQPTGDNYVRRRLRRPSSQGDMTALVLRIITYDAEPDEAAERLYELTFEDDVSLKNQLSHCSFDKLRLGPTNYGVLDVKVNATANGNSRHTLVNLGYEAVLDLIEEDVDDVRLIADFVMFVLPPGTGDWGAYAATPGQQSVYNNVWGGYIGATAHEIGHNLGLEHDFFDGHEYAGVTGYMGAAVKEHHYPLRCYNGQNHWKLGWFSERTLEVDPNIPGIYKVAAFVDYEKAQNDEYVVLKVLNQNLYLQYNRAKLFNRDPGSHGDMLTIVMKQNYGTELLDGLDSNKTLFQLSAGSKVLNIEVCNVTLDNAVEQIDLVEVSIAYDGSLCHTTHDATEGSSSGFNSSPPEASTPIPNTHLRTVAPVESSPEPLRGDTTSQNLNLTDIILTLLSCIFAVVILAMIIFVCRRRSIFCRRSK